MNTLYYLEISDIFNVNKFNQLLPLVSEAKQEKIKQVYFEIDKKLSLYSEIIVRTAICEMLYINNYEIVFEKNRYGKPFLKNKQDYYFNLSHTRNAIVVAISENSIGVDIEKIRKINPKIIKRSFTKSEIAYIMKSEIDIDKRFYEIWTKKEAYIKYIGKGLSMSLNTINVLDDISQQMQTFEKDGYIISVCSDSSNSQYKIVELTENEIESKQLYNIVK